MYLVSTFINAIFKLLSSARIISLFLHLERCYLPIPHLQSPLQILKSIHLYQAHSEIFQNPQKSP